MISVDEHLRSVLDQIEPVGPVTLPVAQAHGLVTTRDVVSTADLPRFDNSAMDGYAVRRVDLAGASPENPVLLPVVGDIPAGDGQPRQQVEGKAWRIMTGAPLPEGADAVVKVEDTDGHVREAQFRVQPDEGAHVRRAGDDVRAGEVVLPAGTRIGAAQLAGLLAAGVTEIEVVGPVRVAVLSTGDELVDAGSRVGRGQIVDSNGPMLEALVREAGCEPVHVGRLADDEKETGRGLREALDEADVVITTGGVSMGAYDMVKAALQGEGSMEFVEVAMQPGKPQGFGRIGRRKVPVFTLPGNPVSALVSFHTFVRPALDARAGRPVAATPTVSGYAVDGWPSVQDRQTYTRVRLSRDSTGGYAATSVGGTGSHMVAALAQADALAVSGPEVTEVTAGSEVELLLITDREALDARLDAERDAASGHDGSADR